MATRWVEDYCELICIYKIENKINGKVYIGQTNNPVKRFQQHMNLKRRETLIKKAINKYGVENFEFDIIDYAYNRKHADILEINFIKQYNSIMPIGYNMKTGGARGKLSDISEKKRIAKLKGRTLSDEHRQKVIKNLVRSGDKKNKAVENQINTTRTLPRLNKISLLKGVYYIKRNKKWLSKIYLNKGEIHLGTYNYRIMAGIAYDLAAIIIYGQTAYLNFPIISKGLFYAKKY